MIIKKSHSFTQNWLVLGPFLAENLIKSYILFFGKALLEALFLCFSFAAFAVFAMANVCQFADCRGKGNWRQNAMYNHEKLS